MKIFHFILMKDFLGFDKERRFGSILGILSLHKKQRWEWVRVTNNEGWNTRGLINDSRAGRTLSFSYQSTLYLLKE